MSDSSNEVLRESVAKHRGAVLSLPKDGAFKHCKTRFLAEDPEGVWLESVRDEAKAIDAAVGAGATVGVAFKVGPNKALFTTTIVRREEGFRLVPGLTTDAILLRNPEKIEGVQRRNDYRVDVVSAADAGELTVRVWRIPEHKPVNERPLPDDELAISVRDLSLSGVGFFCAPENGQPIHMPSGQRLRMVLTYKGMEVLADGHVRHALVLPQKVTRVGVLFTKYEAGELEKHRVARLQLVVGALRREEMRKLRLELLSPAGATRSPAA